MEGREGWIINELVVVLVITSGNCNPRSYLSPWASAFAARSTESIIIWNPFDLLRYRVLLLSYFFYFLFWVFFRSKNRKYHLVVVIDDMTDWWKNTVRKSGGCVLFCFTHNRLGQYWRGLRLKVYSTVYRPRQFKH